MGQSIAPSHRRVVSSQGRLPGFVSEHSGRRCAIDVAVQHELGARDLRASYTDLFDCQLCRQDVVILEVICLIFRMILHRPFVFIDLERAVCFIDTDIEGEQKCPRIVDPGVDGARPVLRDLIYECPWSGSCQIPEPEGAHLNEHGISGMGSGIEVGLEVLIGFLRAVDYLVRHRSITRRLNMELEYAFGAGLREARIHAVAVVLQLLGDFDRACGRHDLHQHQKASEAVIACVHSLSDAVDLALVFQPAERRQAEGAAVLEFRPS